MTYSKMRRKRRLVWGEGVVLEGIVMEGIVMEGIVSEATISTNGFVTSTLVSWKKAMFSGVRSCCIMLMTVRSSWASL